MAPIIETRSLSKSFGSFQAVDDLSFTIQHGDVYGFLGQNGAGKSTTMRMLLGLIKPTQGKVFINGEEFTQGKIHLLKHIGAIIERPDMYGYLSGWNNLKMFARLSGGNIPDARLYEVLEITGLRGREKDKVKAYSQGMKQRLGIAIALVHSPDLLILDEPTNGLDPQGIAEMRRLITHLSKDHGKTILVSSHLLNEIEQVATRMLIVHKGKKMAEGAVRELLNPQDTYIEVRCAEGVELGALDFADWKTYVEKLGKDTILLKMHPDKMPQLNSWLVRQGIGVKEIIARHSLEDYFLSLTDGTTPAHRAV